MDDGLTEKLVLAGSNEQAGGSSFFNSDEADKIAGSASSSTVAHTKGERQPSQCRDAPFAFLFYGHLAAVLAVAVLWGGPVLKSGDGDAGAANGNKNGDGDFSGGLVSTCLIVGAFACLFSGLALLVMMKFAKTLIQTALLFGTSVSLLVALASLLAGQVGAALFGLFTFAVGACYACMVWNRIPFAAANLNTAVAGIRSNFGVMLVGYALVGVALLYTVLWSVALLGVYYKTADCDARGACNGDPSGGYMFLLLLSYFWTQQVIQNTIHVSVAGTVGTWWFVPGDASKCCSRAVVDSFVRSTTLSFGSICLGSLLVATVQTLRYIVEQMRRNNRDNDNGSAASGILLCVADCLLSCLQDAMEYFNRWAYVYVGLYGYPYLTAGKKVSDLFQARGWHSIVSFDLVSGALLVANAVVGLLSGFVGMAALKANASWFATLGDDASAVVFIVSFMIGLLLSSIMMSVVASAVNTVIVCFAEAPAEFQANHPRLSEEMRVAWRGTFPDECGF